MLSSVVMRWDFEIILLFFATAVPLLGRRRIRRLMRMPETTKRDRLTLYASTVAFQWFAVAVILWRISVHQIAFARVGRAIPRPGLTAIVTVLLAALVLANQLVSLRRLTTHPETVQGILPQIALKIFPQDFAERLAFLAVVLTVAVCEELIYRGFAQRVFEDWSRSMILAGIVGSACMFAVAHLYQGGRGIITTLVVGILFSVIRWWTGSLLAPLVAHFIADITAGMLAPARLRAALAVREAQPIESIVNSETTIIVIW
jgi:membrane protease YdiL (CAAX protease family)